MRSLKIILLSTAFNGLTQRAWLSLREAGHEPSVVLFSSEEEVCRQIEDSGAQLVICPFLKDRVPAQLWRNAERPVVIIHPGIVGDRGASALDWAISRKLSYWGVTAMQAAEEMDSGAIWATREFEMPAQVRKSQLYNGPVADAALACIHEVVAKFGTDFEPTPLNYDSPEVRGHLQPNMKQSDRSFSWHDGAEFIKRRIDAADGQPGVLATLQGEQFYLYDAHLDSRCGTPGQLLAVHDLRLLQWSDEHRTVPSAGECAALGQGAGHQGPGISGWARQFLQRRAPERHSEAWANIRAINDVCRELLSARQLVISGLTGSAGAGGVMLALAADVVLARDGIVLNPHYKTMGLYGSEYWTYSLPRAVGSDLALQLTQQCLPLSTTQALAMGMLQGIGPRCPQAFGEWLMGPGRRAAQGS